MRPCACRGLIVSLGRMFGPGCRPGRPGWWSACRWTKVSGGLLTSALRACFAHHRCDRKARGRLGTVPIKNLTPDAVRAWHSATLVDKPTYRSHAYGLLHAVLATAVVDGLIPVNPCHIPRAASAKAKRAPVIPTVEELAKAADVIDERNRTLLLVSAWCGLRWGEVSELRRKDVGEGAETITVGRGVVHRQANATSKPRSRAGAGWW